MRSVHRTGCGRFAGAVSALDFDHAGCSMTAKHTPKLPALESEPTNDTAALTCYALDWREEALKAQQQCDDLLQALEEIANNDPYNQSSAGIIARAAIAKAKGE